MLIRICLGLMLMVANTAWLVAQQNLGTANLGGPKWEGPLTWDREDISICNQGHHLLYDPERLGVRKTQTAPFMLQYEWKLNRDEAAVNVPSNRETWTEFALVRKVALPSKLVREDTRPERRYRLTEYHVQYPRSMWFAALAYRYPINQLQEPIVRYQITKEPTAIAPQYEGMINCAPPLIARAKTIEALEAKLLEMFCDCITQMVEEDTQQAVANAKASNPLEHVPPGWWDIPAVQFGY